MLIFDRFPGLPAAGSFAEHVATEYGRDVSVRADRDDELDPFPFELTGPVVYVDRPNYDREDEIIAAVEAFGGSFAGT